MFVGNKAVGPAQKRVVACMHFPGGKLAKMLEEEDERYRKGTKTKKIKFVERGGTTIIDILGRKNPWAREGCDREDCLPCSEEKGKGGNCQQESITYRITCRECARRSVKAEYTGESSRTSYLRGKEHMEGLEKESDDNALWKHCVTEHSGEKVKFGMKVLRSHRSPLTRQIQESVETEV